MWVVMRWDGWDETPYRQQCEYIYIRGYWIVRISVASFLWSRILRCGGIAGDADKYGPYNPRLIPRRVCVLAILTHLLSNSVTH